MFNVFLIERLDWTLDAVGDPFPEPFFFGIGVEGETAALIITS